MEYTPNQDALTVINFLEDYRKAVRIATIYGGGDTMLDAIETFQAQVDELRAELDTFNGSEWDKELLEAQLEGKQALLNKNTTLRNDYENYMLSTVAGLVF